MLRREADPDLVMKAICDDHQNHSPMCLSKHVGFRKFGEICYLPSRNLTPRWWRAEEVGTGRVLDLHDEADGAVFRQRGRYVWLTCRFVDAVGVEREETYDECLAHVKSIKWPPR